MIQWYSNDSQYFFINLLSILTVMMILVMVELVYFHLILKDKIKKGVMDSIHTSTVNFMTDQLSQDQSLIDNANSFLSLSSLITSETLEGVMQSTLSALRSFESDVLFSRSFFIKIAEVLLPLGIAFFIIFLLWKMVGAL